MEDKPHGPIKYRANNPNGPHGSTRDRDDAGEQSARKATGGCPGLRPVGAGKYGSPAEERIVLTDGGWIVESNDDDVGPDLDPDRHTHWSDLEGVQQDALALLFGGDGPMRAATVHGQLERSYDRPVDDQAVADALDQLTREGLVVRERGVRLGQRVDPRPSQYYLTSEGRYVVRSYGQWLQSQIERRRNGGEK